MARVAQDKGVTLVDAAKVLERHPAPLSLYGDQVHPTPEGHRRIAEYIYPVIEPMLPR